MTFHDIQTNKVSAVIVAYNPDRADLVKLVNSAAHQVDHIFIINNGSTICDLAPLNYKNLSVHQLDKNYGIGYAQNLGVKFSLDYGSLFSILLDQDSCLAPDYVRQLLPGFYKDGQINDLVAAVGPQVIDCRSRKRFPFYSYGALWRRISSHTYNNNKEFLETDHLISSGTIVNNYIFSIHQNNSELFIEYVDIEWCLRVRKSGHLILFNPNVYLMHKLGDGRRKVFGIEIPFHKPDRYYYVFRNGLFCILRTNFFLSWKVFNCLRLLALFNLLLYSYPQKRSLIWSVFRGVSDAFKIKKY